MLARVLIIVIVNTAFLAAVLWLIPIEGILAARGYTPAQIAALQAAATPETASERTDESQHAAASGSNEGISGTATGGADQGRRTKLIATAAVNIRTGQSTDSAVIGQVASGDVVTVLKDFGGEWVRIQYGDLRGWVYRPLFKQAAETNTMPRLVATATVNVRTGPGTNHSAVGQVTPGEIVTVLKNPGGEWVRIKIGDLRGWVYRPLFKPKGG